MIRELTPEQHNILLEYRNKWNTITFSPRKISEDKIRDVLNHAYELLGYPNPTLFFFNSPIHSLNHLGHPPTKTPLDLFFISNRIIGHIKKQFTPLFWTQLWRRSGYLYTIAMYRSIGYPLIIALEDQIEFPLCEEIKDQIGLICNMVSDIAIIDFAISILGCKNNFSQEWEILQALVKNCIWHFGFVDYTILCNYPLECSVNFQSFWQRIEDTNLNITFSDGFHISAEYRYPYFS